MDRKRRRKDHMQLPLTSTYLAYGAILLEMLSDLSLNGYRYDDSESTRRSRP
jgi:hypothetical protein